MKKSVFTWVCGVYVWQGYLHSMQHPEVLSQALIPASSAALAVAVERSRQRAASLAAGSPSAAVAMLPISLLGEQLCNSVDPQQLLISPEQYSREVLYSEQVAPTFVESSAAHQKYCNLMDFFPEIAQQRVYQVSALEEPVVSLDIGPENQIAILWDKKETDIRHGRFGAAIYGVDGNKRCDFDWSKSKLEIGGGAHMIRFVPGYSRIVTGYFSNTSFAVWDTHGEYQSLMHSARSTCMIASLPSGRIFSVGENRACIIVNRLTAGPGARVPWETWSVGDLKIRAMVPAGDSSVYFVTGSDEVYRLVHDAQGDHIQKEVQVGSDRVLTSLAMSRTNNYVAMGSEDGVVTFCHGNLGGYRILNNVRLEGGAPQLVSGAQEVYVVAHNGRVAHVYDWDGTWRYALPCPAQSFITSLAVASDGTLVIGLNDGRIQVWNIQRDAVDAVRAMSSDQLKTLRSLTASIANGVRYHIPYEAVLRGQSVAFFKGLPELLQRNLIAQYRFSLQEGNVTVAPRLPDQGQRSVSPCGIKSYWRQVGCSLRNSKLAKVVGGIVAVGVAAFAMAKCVKWRGLGSYVALLPTFIRAWILGFKNPLVWTMWRQTGILLPASYHGLQ